MKMPPSLALFASSLLAGMTLSAAAPAGFTNPAAQVFIQTLLQREAVRLDSEFLEGITNRAQWEERRVELRRQYFEMLGLWPLPERTPLQAQVTGTLERGEGFRVEKVHFQSRPRLYVTGNLYLPKDARPGAKLPAVLYVCGHSARGRDGNKSAFQHHGMWFATHGYVCLIIDSLQLGEIAAIHHGTYRHDRWWWQARGYAPSAVECWNGMRSLDYLQSRAEVDPERLAVTGISGGGAATFWIAAADERVKVAVPVSGMDDLEDYVGGKIVNGHCDCMFLINTFQWPWTQIAALVAPRPLLFENSGHDPIFPMSGNDRIRARLERLYGFYTNRTERLFDIGITPGGHSDNPELRLMAYRWIHWHLKGSNAPVTEPELPAFDGKDLRVFANELPSDELNSRIDEVFVPMATNALPATVSEWQTWRQDRLGALQRLVFRPEHIPSAADLGAWSSSIHWKLFPGAKGDANGERWMVVLGPDESLETKPAWVDKLAGEASVLLIAPFGTGPMQWQDPAPFAIRRSLALLGRSVDSERVRDVLAALTQVLPVTNSPSRVNMTGMFRRLSPAWAGNVTRTPDRWIMAGRGNAGVIAAYAALFEPRLSGVVLVDPPASHRDGPIFLNVLRVLDVPEALGMLAPCPLTIHTAQESAFARTASLYGVSGGHLKFSSLP